MTGNLYINSHFGNINFLFLRNFFQFKPFLSTGQYETENIGPVFRIHRKIADIQRFLRIIHAKGQF